MVYGILHGTRIWRGSALLLSLFLLLLVNAANAQSSKVTVTADVATPVSVGVSGGSDNAGTVNLGLVLDGNTGAVNANTSSSAGLFTVTAGAGMLANVTFTSPTVTLTDSSGATLSFTPQVVGDTLSTVQSTAPALTSGEQITISGAGLYYIWLGGSVVIPSAQVAGTYIGTFSITVSY